ncbi:type II-A CRISPR-associated protein Csn2 [Lactiplantibacillus modestisalitolerans]|uniref:Type II-A CRISPR-associated protein Csn2 n=1 Tax=Lactiplantibacillus modestisalitolerans TaxID=1457219 RepID=A0ABV5WTD0_9LACO|nr:type II-A CRISPR-associated protein Csn2 [Lactiplantibacillus modestisalitolerans]
MNITYYPFKPFEVKANQFNVFDIGHSKMYYDFCRGFQDSADTLCTSDDNFHVKTVTSQYSWYGDLMLSVDLNKLFLRKIQHRIIDIMAEEQRIDLIDQSRKIISQVSDISFLMDLPLEISDLPNIDQVIKFAGISFPSDLKAHPEMMLETLIQTHVELGSKKTIVLTNVSHYITFQQLQKVKQVLQELNATVILIEYSECSRKDKFNVPCYYYVDEDLVDWRS